MESETSIGELLGENLRSYEKRMEQLEKEVSELKDNRGHSVDDLMKSLRSRGVNL
jgi:uncharacterized protein (UPF0335 family)